MKATMRLFLLVSLSIVLGTSNSFARTTVDDKTIDLRGTVQKRPLKSPPSGNPTGSPSDNVDWFVKATLNTHTLTISFFDIAQGVTISVYHETEGLVSEETTDVNATSIFTIDLSTLQNGNYEIWIHNNQGMNISGYFLLEDE